MQPPSHPAEQLVVRQHERFHCRLGSHLRVGDEVAEQVVLARTMGDGTGAIEASITDTSRGGLGIESPMFFPRGCRLRVRVKPSTDGAAPDHDLLVRVQRVSMLDRRPTYYLGVSFTSKGPEHDLAVTLLLEMARKNQNALQAPAGSPAALPLSHTAHAPHSPPDTSIANGKGGR